MTVKKIGTFKVKSLKRILKKLSVSITHLTVPKSLREFKALTVPKPCSRPCLSSTMLHTVLLLTKVKLLSYRHGANRVQAMTVLKAVIMIKGIDCVESSNQVESNDSVEGPDNIKSPDGDKGTNCVREADPVKGSDPYDRGKSYTPYFRLPRS